MHSNAASMDGLLLTGVTEQITFCYPSLGLYGLMGYWRLFLFYIYHSSFQSGLGELQVMVGPLVYRIMLVWAFDDVCLINRRLGLVFSFPLSCHERSSGVQEEAFSYNVENVASSCWCIKMMEAVIIDRFNNKVQ